MAGYPKIWTTIRHEDWFKSLGAVQRNIWLETILIAKEQKDNGWVTFKNVTHFAIETGTERRSIEHWIGRETAQDRVSNLHKSKKLLQFFITNYNTSQGVKRYKPKNIDAPNRKHISNKAKTTENSGFSQNPFKNKDNKDPDRINQTRIIGDIIKGIQER